MSKKFVPAVFLSLCMLILLAVSCGSEDDAQDDQPIDGDACSTDSDCPKQQICGDEGVCQSCQPCEVRSDCPSGYSCFVEQGCCKQVGCAKDFECDEPQYCIDMGCKVKSCTEDSECTRAEHFCWEGQCAKKECTTHEDCDSKLCNMESYQCENCNNDADCPGFDQICSNGNCIANPYGDSDGTGELKGCEEFQQGCLYNLFTCFDKIDPWDTDDDFSSCIVIENDEGETRGYAFNFSDGSNWRWYLEPETYYEAYGTQRYCYKLVPEDVVTGRFGYYDQMGELLGTYLIDPDAGSVNIVCADGTQEWYSLAELRESYCDGFLYVGVYSPPPPGIELCGEGE